MTAARELTGALHGRWCGDYGVASCPVPTHGRGRGDRNPSLAIRERDDRLFVFCNSGCAQDAVIDALKARGLWVATVAAPSSPSRVGNFSAPRTSERSEVLGRREAALQIWRNAKLIAGTVGELYFCNRGITGALPASLRFAHLRHGPTGLDLPAVVAAVQSDTAVTAIQRIFLTLDGRKKSPCSDPKLCLGPLERGAVRLAKTGPVLGLTEHASYSDRCWRHSRRQQR